jgi:dipeptidase E
MRARAPQIVALGGGGFSMEKDGSLLDDYVLSLTAAPRPRVCFLPTASGDADHYVVRFYRRFSPVCEASHVSLFRRDQGTGGVEDDLATHLQAQDLIYVGGGNVVSMLGAWRAHGLDGILQKAWRKGVVLCGPSAGSLCWFREALSAFHGAPRRVRGLGLLPYSNCVHYDAEPARRGEYHRLVGEGMPAGFAVEDSVALHFRGTCLERAVSSRPTGAAYLVEPTDNGVIETRLDVSYLGAAASARDSLVATSESRPPESKRDPLVAPSETCPPGSMPVVSQPVDEKLATPGRAVPAALTPESVAA